MLEGKERWSGIKSEIEHRADLGVLPLSEMDPVDNPTASRPERLRWVGAMWWGWGLRSGSERGVCNYQRRR